MARTDSNATGILLVDKPQGISSHAVVSRVRRWFGTRKVGHAGTLDPMATGLLVVGLGRGTKLLTYIVGADKTYEAVIRLGASTPTDDADSAPDVHCSAGALAALGAEQIASAMSAFRGEIEQVPSQVSAVKVDGRRAYARVRAGEDVELRARPVTISDFSVSSEPIPRSDGSHSYIDVPVRVRCSSGTYVRALARDLGSALGTGGHLTVLRRTEVGDFDVRDAVSLPADDELGPRGSESSLLLSLGAVAASVMRPCRVSVEQAEHLLQGKFLPAESLLGEDWDVAQPCAALLEGDGRAVAVIERVGPRLKVATALMGLESLRESEVHDNN